MATTCLTGKLFFEMLQSGTANLELHSSEVNDLHRFIVAPVSKQQHPKLRGLHISVQSRSLQVNVGISLDVDR